MIDDIQRLARALGPRYRMGRLIGRGGAAHVYVADDTVCHRQVAVKILRTELASSTSAERFKAEIRVAAQLRHPNIVPIYATGEVDGLPYYVMPFIDGQTLRERLDRARRLSIGEALRITADVARALDFAHRRHVVHRDIKPENVMLRNGRAVLLDFGIALSINEPVMPRHTSPGIRVGTIEYMSPEQAVGERTIDGRSDIYSLACVAYEMLAGQPPFSGPPFAVMNWHATAQPRALVSICPEIPQSISQVLSRALGKVPAERMATAGELVASLRRASAGHTPPRRCIAVLSTAHPFAGGCAGASSEAITEQIADALADLPDIDVAAGSTFPILNRKLHLAHIARELGAREILFTNACETTHSMRLNGMLLGAETGVVIWSGTFTGRKGECESVLSELAPELARAVGSAMVRAAEHAPDAGGGVGDDAGDGLRRFSAV
jgi:serine/threonine-protein kinase